MDDELLRSLPKEYAALADRRTVMLEVAEKLQELHATTTRLGDALESAGLPGREWRYDDASLAVLSRSLPDMTVDELSTLLAEFAAGQGPEWLHGDARDLENFSDEVADLYDLVRALRSAARRLQIELPQMRRDARLLPIERAFGSARVAPPLDRAVALLGDLEALRRFIRPLSPAEWDGSAEDEVEGGPSASTLRRTLPMPPHATHKRLRDFAPPKGAGHGASAGGGRFLAPLRARMRSLASALLRRKQLIAPALVLFVGAGVAVLVAVQPRPSAANIVPAATTPTATTVLATPTARPATRPAAVPPRLTLDCAVQDANSATIALRNSGTVSLSWQANPPDGLRVQPGQGRLSAGQSATLVVTTTNGRRSPTGTIAFTAATSTSSATFSVTCH